MSLRLVILSGGSGTRLWPISRANYPKQFQGLLNNNSMIRNTVERVKGLDFESIVTICNEEHKFYALEEVGSFKNSSIILEPYPKNTAPAIALAALNSDPDSIMLVMPADHYIKENSIIQEAILKGKELASADKLVVFGISPTEPHIGYGYIKKGSVNNESFLVDKFVEKPSIDLAKKYLESKDYYWNSGMFMFKAKTYLSELKLYRPEIYEICNQCIKNQKINSKFIEIKKDIFVNCPSESIDYSVMENTKNALVIPLNVSWSDIGSWSSLHEASKRDKDNNTISGDVMVNNTSNTLIKADDRFVAVNDVDDLIIVTTKDSILVSSKKNDQDIKYFPEKLNEINRHEWKDHREIKRPWGKFDSIDNGPGFQVKRLTVKPKQKLSVQMHYHRSEHWVVVSGIARVHYGEKWHDLKPNESTYHDKEVVHALENPGEDPLILIEVQCGEYLGEDDIVRFSDNYGRVEEDEPLENNK